ncbi:phosphoribosylamine--glycine ligase [Thioalkalivibrio sp. HK1]|uniref:phosphoribosylamine--glycine ligase n=1 Tax=Thioalkalivibrio sp. HK1 TaxID=1469245 RepID=UPI00046FF3FE|nr:phosphoribosylamine--glycine ligase [Thioalkalivibrio sp. HK1]
MSNTPHRARTLLVIGGGGREHALVWSLARSPEVSRVLVAPGNAGTSNEPKVENLPIADHDIEALALIAKERKVDLTVVGPETPLVAGIVDHFSAQGLRIFGPSAAAARLEGSKSFAKDFLARHRIPTAAHGVFTRIEDAKAYIEKRRAPIVIKADGLAAGKGVIVARSNNQAIEAAREMLEGGAFGGAGRTIVIEDFLAGEEASFICVAGSQGVVPLASAQDHKTLLDGDEGPNTGGMGAYSPAPVVDARLSDRIMREIIHPTLQGLAAEGMPYTGFLYAGLMIDPDGAPHVIEFNCRLGDPETQPILLRLRSSLLDLIEAALAGDPAKNPPEWDERASLGVVMASEGYPEKPRKGDVIHGLDESQERTGEGIGEESGGSGKSGEVDNPVTKVFHAGTALQGDRVVTSGGRVLCICALGKDVSEARRIALDRADGIQWPGAFFRRDIGHRAIAREEARAKKIG